MPQNKWFAASPNTDYIFRALTDGTVTKLTQGRIPKMNAIQAAGLLGSWLIETGRKDLRNLDVVEVGSGAGRGLSQYTGVRRTPYDRAAASARAAGQDPNSAQWQLRYFAQEYMNRDLIGWTRVFEEMPKNLRTPGEYARYFTGSAAEGRGYFRPGTPHTDRRIEAAQEVFRHYSNPKKTPAAPDAGQPAQQGFDPIKAIQRIFQPNSAAGDLVISPATGRRNQNSNAADFLSIKPGDLSGATQSRDKQVKLPGLYDIANASIGNIGRSASGYGSTVFSPSFPAARISERSFGGSVNLGRDLGIRSASSGGYSLPTASSSVGNAWKTGFGIN